MATELEGSVLEFSSPIADAKKPLPLPPGDYIGTIREAKIMLSQNNKKYVNVVFFIPPQQYPVDYTDGSPDGMTMSYGLVSGEDTPRGRWSQKAFAEALGLPAPQTKVDVTEWLNIDAKLHVVADTYQGERTSKIGKIGRAA